MQSETDEKNGKEKAHRRARSVTRAEEITTKHQKQRKSQPDKPCHRPRDSLFSWSSGFQNFTGLVNWGFLLLTMSGFRLCLENLIKYGIRVDPFQWFIVLTGRDEGSGVPSIILLIYSLVPICICLLIERGLSLEIIRESAGMFAHVLNIIVLVLIPMVIIHVNGNAFSMIGAMTVCFHYSILFMKLWSYIQVNMWCRNEQKDPPIKMRHRSSSITLAELHEERTGVYLASFHKTDKDVVPLVNYPDNLRFKDLFYFLCAPTLCYELNFPRTTRIRKRFLLKRVLEVVIGANVVLALFQQWMIPAVRNALIPFSNMDVAKATERLLKLAIPNHLVWLIFFYLSFHSFLNLIGELLHFADRNFYCDWWNANNIDTFWRTWNMPVHRWCVRHIYIPIVDLGYSRMYASLIVFFVSAFFHEYLSFSSETKLRVLIKEDSDVNGDATEFRGIQFVTMSMMLVLNMISQDLNLPIEYLNKGCESDKNDIYINFDDEDKVYDVTLVERIWPHYQNRYCLIYANAVKYPPDTMMIRLSRENIAMAISFGVGWAFFFILFLARKHRGWFDLLSRSFFTSVQSQVMSSTPEIKLRTHEKFFMGGKLIHNLLTCSLYMSFFGTQFILPRMRFTNDEEAAKVYGRQIDPLTEFGIGEPCLFELKQGMYRRRCCFLACDFANKTVQTHNGIVFLTEEVNFQNIFKVSEKSPYFADIKRLIRLYLEAGLLDQIFKDIHKNSHKFLEEMQYSGHISLSELWPLMGATICKGYITATVALIGELIYYRWQNGKLSKAKKREIK